MAWWNNRDDDEEEEETGSASSRVIDAVKNLYQRVVDNQRRAVEADQAVARETARQVTNAPKAVYSALDRATQSTAQANMAVQRAQTQKVQDAARNIYGAYQQQQERAARDQMAEQARQLQARQQRMQAATAALYRQSQSQIQQQANRNQAETMRKVYGAVDQAAAGGGIGQTLEKIRNGEDLLANSRDAINKLPRLMADADLFQGYHRQMAESLGFDQRNEEAMRREMERAGYTGEQIQTELGRLRESPVDPLDRYRDTESDTWQGQVAANYELGELQNQADLIIGQGVIDNNQDMIRRGMEMRELAKQYAVNNQEALNHDSGWLGNMVFGNLAQHAPQALLQQAAALPAQILPTLLPNKVTEAIAQATGSGAMSFRTMAGAAYIDLIEKGADHETAARMAMDEAAISAAIESADTFKDWAFGPLSGLNPFEKIGEKAATKLAGRVALGFGKWAGNTEQEYIEEASQEMVSMANEQRLADGNTDGGWLDLMGYTFDQAKETVPELFDVWKKDALGLFLKVPGMKEKFPELLDAYKGIETTENAERANEAGRGGAIVGGFMSLFGQATGAVRSSINSRYNRAQINQAFDSLVENTDAEDIGQLTDAQLTDAAQTARDMGRADAAEILETELARRQQPETVRETAPGNEGLRSEFATRAAEPEAAQIAPERQAAVEQAAQDIRNAAQSQDGFTGGSGMQYSQEQADALAQLSNDTLIAGAETSFTVPYNRLGITEEQAAALRNAGLLGTETAEDGSTFEYLYDAAIYDERQRRREQDRAARAQRMGDQGMAPPIERYNAPAQTQQRTPGLTLATEAGRLGDVEYDAVDYNTLNDTQRSIVDATGRMAEALGLDVTVINAAGNVGGAYQKGGKIYLNIASGMDLQGYSKAIAESSFAHELGHWMKDAAKNDAQAAADYQALQDMVLGAMSEDQLESLIQEKLAAEPNLTREGAIEEVVSDAIQPLLQDSKAFEQLARENPSLAQRILDFLKQFLDRIRDAFGEVDYSDNLPIYHAVQAIEDSLGEMQETYDRALLSARDYQQRRNAEQGTDATDEALKNSTLSFQMNGEVEATDQLVAVHNKSISGLRRMLRRGGIPFPSIAIKKAGTSHEGFGDVSIVFPRSTIDPQEDRQNRLYSNDAWTPTEPPTEYEVDIPYKLKNQIAESVGEEIFSALNGYSYLDDGEVAKGLMNSQGDLFDALKGRSVVKYAYLKSIGQDPKVPGRAERLDGFGKYKNEQLMAIFDALTPSEIENLSYENGDDQRIADILNEQFRSQFKGDDTKFKALLNKPLYSADRVSLNAIKDAWRKYSENGHSIRMEPDSQALNQMLRDNKDIENDPGFREWVEKTFGDTIKGSGIPNGKDPYTSSGNRRSFKQTHVPATLENIVAQMRKENEKGIGVMGINLRGAATKTYDTVEEMRADSGKLLGTRISDDEYDSYMSEFHGRLHEITRQASPSERWETQDSTQEILLETLRDAKTKEQMDRMLKKEARWINLYDGLTDQLWQLKRDVQDMPAPYFEAKPRRIVYPEEALAYILPDNAGQDIQNDLKNRGFNVMLYKAGDEADRLQKLNSVPEARFQRWGETENEQTQQTADTSRQIEEADETGRNDLRGQLDEALNRFRREVPDVDYQLKIDPETATEEELRKQLADLEKAYNFYTNIEEAAENLQPKEDQEERKRLLDLAKKQVLARREAQRQRWNDESSREDDQLADELTSTTEAATEEEAPSEPAPAYTDGTMGLFGPTNEEQEAKAAEQAGKTANEALSQYIEDLPDDPMDLYTKQQKVTAEKKGEERITTKKNPKKKTLRQKVSEGWHGFIRLMANDGDAIHQAGRQTGNKALDGMFFYAKAARQRAQDWIQGKRMSFGLDKTGDSLNSIFDPIRAKGDEYYKDFQLYVYHMLNVERMSRSTGDEVPALKDTLKQLRQKAHRHGIDLGSMTDDELQRRAQAYKEGGVGGLYDEIGDLASQYWETKKDLMRAERQQNKPVFGWDEGAPDADESKKISDDLLAAHPEFADEAQKVYDYIDDLLQYRVDAGLITQADMDNLKSIYPHYVPVLYDYEDAPQEIRKGGLTVSSTIKSAQGGDTTLLPLHYALARQTLSVMRNAGFQQLGGTVLGEYENSGELMGKWVQDVKESEAAWDPSMADNEVPQTRENVVTVFRNGKRYDMTLSPDMAYAFNSLQPSGENNALEQFAAGANNLFKALCTSKNPLFVFTNSMRDFQEALFYSTDTARWIKNFPRAYKQIAGNGKYWQMYQAMGGVYNSLFDWATGEDIGDKGGKPGKVEMLNMWVEQAPRLSEFMTVLENAERDHGTVTQDDLMEAFNAAAEVTTNFSRSGTMGRYINRYVVPFWNPGVQGLSKVVRTATETRGFKNWATLALKTAVLGMLPQVLNGLLYRDDDEWDVIDDEVKANYYLFKSKDGVWIKIPKGRVLAALSVPVVGTMEAMRGDDVKWGKLGKAAISSVAPNNPLTTNLFSPIVETRLWDPNDPGKTWYGGDIESKRLQGYAPGQRYDESTDAISKWIGEKLNVSPKKINYIIDQYSGVLGDLLLPYLTPKAERGVYVGDVAVPLSNSFLSRFTTDTVTSNTIGNEYYGLLDELTWKANAGDDAAAMAKKYMNRAGGTVSDYYAQIRKIENDPNLSDKEKTTLTRELRKQLNAYEQQVTADAKAYLETAQEYVDQHPESDYTDDKAVDAFVEGYNSTQTDEKNMITADDAAKKMQDEVYRETNRKHFGSEYALQVYNKDVYAKAQQANEDAGVSFDDYYDYYFGTKNLKSDKDENGKTVNGSKKEKVVAFIDGMDIPDEQKDALYLASGYTETTLEDAPWNGGTGKYTGSSGSGSGRKKTPETRLKEYRDVQAKKAADPNYNPAADGHAWTVWADRAVESGIRIEDAVKHMTELGKFTADYDQFGKPITGSKKEKVVDYIQSQKGLTKAQKDTLYLYVYGENSLRFTPWHGWTGDKKKTGSRSRRRGGRRRSGGSAASRSVKQVGKLDKGYSSNGIDASALFGTSGSGRSRTQNASAASDLLEIINKYYGGNALAAAMDGGKRAKGRTTVDFKL